MTIDYSLRNPRTMIFVLYLIVGEISSLNQVKEHNMCAIGASLYVSWYPNCALNGENWYKGIPGNI